MLDFRLMRKWKWIVDWSGILDKLNDCENNESFLLLKFRVFVGTEGYSECFVY